MPVTIRPAELTDLDAIGALTGRRRQELAAWEPVYWNMRVGADDLHPHFLRYCIEAPATVVQVAVEGDEVVGCSVAQPQHDHWFLDDLCVRDQRWSDVAAALVASLRPRPMVVCCPRRDAAEVAWLAGSGAQLASEYHALDLRSRPVVGSLPEAAPMPTEDVGPVVHTFANGRIDPTATGALEVEGHAGDVVATPPVAPPMYDPGGTTTVIERITGEQRGWLLDRAIDAAAARGDAQLIVVCASGDGELRGLLERAGSTVPVDVWRV